jgi:hypothetical protein
VVRREPLRNRRAEIAKKISLIGGVRRAIAGYRGLPGSPVRQKRAEKTATGRKLKAKKGRICLQIPLPLGGIEISSRCAGLPAAAAASRPQSGSSFVRIAQGGTTIERLLGTE